MPSAVGGSSAAGLRSVSLPQFLESLRLHGACDVSETATHDSTNAVVDVPQEVREHPGEQAPRPVEDPAHDECEACAIAVESVLVEDRADLVF